MTARSTYFAPGLLVLLNLSLTACHDPAPSAKPAAKPAEAAAAAPAVSEIGRIPLSTATAVGVQECDAYLSLYRTCIETKIPPAQQAPYREAFVQGQIALQKAVDGTGNTAKLAENCTMARAAARTALAKFGCDDF